MPDATGSTGDHDGLIPDVVHADGLYRCQKWQGTTLPAPVARYFAAAYACGSPDCAARKQDFVTVAISLITRNQIGLPRSSPRRSYFSTSCTDAEESTPFFLS